MALSPPSVLRRGFFDAPKVATAAPQNASFMSAARAALPKNEAAPPRRPKTPQTVADLLVAAAGEGDLKLMDKLLGFPGVSVNRPAASGHTPLLVASMQGSLKVVDYLCRRGASVVQPAYLLGPHGIERWTPLMATMEHMQYVDNESAAGDARRADFQALALRLMAEDRRVLLARDPKGNLPLHVATRGAMSGLVPELLRVGCCPRARNDVGDTPLHIAARMGWLGAALAFMQKVDRFPGQRPSGLFFDGADPQALNQQGQTALHAAVEGGNGALVRALVRRGVPLQVRDATGETASELVARMLQQPAPEQEAALLLMQAALAPGLLTRAGMGLAGALRRFFGPGTHV